MSTKFRGVDVAKVKKNRAREIANKLGSAAELARVLGLAESTVRYWVKVTGEIPAKHVLVLEKATQGRFSRSYIRPDLYQN